MGFTTGLLGGLTLTYSVLYLSLYVHRANRQYQHILLSQQSVLLNSVVEPLPPLPEPPAYDLQKVSLVETLKDRWNREVEGLVRRVEETDWDQVRARWESRVGTIWAKIRESEASDRLKEKVTRAGDEVKQAADSTHEQQSPEPERLLEIK